MTRASHVAVFPKAWDQKYTYLRSPLSQVVHFAFRVPPEERNGELVIRTQPLCKVVCWTSVVAVLPEDLEAQGLRFCKDCLRRVEYWGDDHVFALRADFIQMEHCALRHK